MILQSICFSEPCLWPRQFLLHGVSWTNLPVRDAYLTRVGCSIICTIAEGQIFLLFLPPQSLFPIDGIRFQDQEVKYTIPIGNTRVSSLFQVQGNAPSCT
jgi:hypothetical protein